MIFEYALTLMAIVCFINNRTDGAIIAVLFVIVSLSFDWIISTTTFVDSYVIYALGELTLIYFMNISNGPERLVKDMKALSTLSIVVQLSGLLMWMGYYESTLYMALCQMVFILQIIRLIAHGLARREASNTQRGFMDSIHTSNSDKKL